MDIGAILDSIQIIFDILELTLLVLILRSLSKQP